MCGPLIQGVKEGRGAEATKVLCLSLGMWLPASLCGRGLISQHARIHARREAGCDGGVPRGNGVCVLPIQTRTEGTKALTGSHIIY